MRKSREDILAALNVVAKSLGSTTVGKARFNTITGIRVSEWSYYWPRWNDLLEEAGLEPGEMGTKLADDEVVLALIPLVQKLGRWPASNDLRIHARETPGFPSEKTIRSRGAAAAHAQALITICRENPDNADVLKICTEFLASRPTPKHIEIETTPSIQGYVYLMKNGKYHKIGRAKNADQRRKEVAVMLPDDVTTVHAIPTDDPSGIEAYWHNRFRDKRHRGEWFLLTPADVAAFKRRKDYM